MDSIQLVHALPYTFGGVLVLLLLVGLVTRVLKHFSPANIEVRVSPTEADYNALELQRQNEVEDNVQRCVCGELATNPSPQLIRQRTSILQTFFAMAPKYRREVPRTSWFFGLAPIELPREQYVYCLTHAHVADAMLDKFIYHDIRAMQAKNNEDIAIRAAGFEQEALVEQIKNSLTDTQKKAQRRGQTQVRLLQKTGTDSAGSPNE